MRKLRIHRSWQSIADALDAFGNFAQTSHVRLRVAATFFISNDRETLAQRIGQLPFG